SYDSLSARGGQACAGIVGHRNHPRAQSSQRRSDALAGRHPDDAIDRGSGKAARHFGARPHHRRQGRPFQSEGVEADLTTSALEQRRLIAVIANSTELTRYLPSAPKATTSRLTVELFEFGANL